MTEPCLIQLSITKQEKWIQVTISDNGSGFKSLIPMELFKQGTGLKNVNDRLVFTLGQQSALEFGAQYVRFNLPNRKVDDEVSVS